MKKFLWAIAALTISLLTSCVPDPSGASPQQPGQPAPSANERRMQPRDSQPQLQLPLETAPGANLRVGPDGAPVPVVANMESFKTAGDFSQWGQAWQRQVVSQRIKNTGDYVNQVPQLLYRYQGNMTGETLWDAFSMCSFTIKNLWSRGRVRNAEKLSTNVTANLTLLLRYCEEEGLEPTLAAALKDMLESREYIPTHLRRHVKQHQGLIRDAIDEGWGWQGTKCRTHDCWRYWNEWGSTIPVSQ